MSWSHGSELMEKIIQTAQKFIEDDDDRTLFYEEIITVFHDDFDCDTLDECLEIDPAFDEAMDNAGYLEEEEDWSDVDDGWGYEDEDDRY